LTENQFFIELGHVRDSEGFWHIACANH